MRDQIDYIQDRIDEQYLSWCDGEVIKEQMKAEKAVKIAEVA